MQQSASSPAAAVLLAVVLLIGNSAVGAVRTRSMAFEEARARRAANYIGPQDAATAHRKLLQLPVSPAAQIFLDGIIEDAALDPACAGSATCGGTIKVNGIVVTVPKNLIVMFPASALTWQEMFQTVNGGNNGVSTGLALNDAVKSGSGTYLASVAANRVDSSKKIIAALIDISQDATSTGSGYISSIDYDTGALHIETATGSTATVRLNDPTGRYGIIQTGLDPRFSVDTENPTVRAATGYPMCIPKVDPNAAAPAPSEDPNCSKLQRPLDAAGNPATTITTADPTVLPVGNPNPLKMMPFRVGDYVTYAGVLVGPSSFAAYEVVNNVAVYTVSGTSPAYSVVETALIGTGGLNVLGAGEAAVRTRYEGFTTDPLSPVQMFALDFNADTGAFTTRDLGEDMPDPGPVFGGATRGRWRFRPPCTVVPQNPKAGLQAGVDAYQGNKGCTAPSGGVYTPPTREVMSNVKGCTPAKVITAQGDAVDGGCIYRNPTIEYIWPENVPGAPVVPSNFDVLPFLANGGYTSAGKTKVGRLDPWPGSNLPTPPGFDPSKLPLDSNLNIQSIVFRCDKHRMTITAAFTNPPATLPPLFLANYIDNSGNPGKPIDISTLGNTLSPVAGVPTIVIEPVPQPSRTQNSLMVYYTAGAGGRSPTIALNVNQVKASGKTTCTI